MNRFDFHGAYFKHSRNEIIDISTSNSMASSAINDKHDEW